jgi:hypothetical protein
MVAVREEDRSPPPLATAVSFIEQRQAAGVLFNP